MMKTPKMQILSMLQAFRQEDVLKAFELYKNENETRRQLLGMGWSSQTKPPIGREYFHIGGEYWIQKQTKKCPHCGNILSLVANDEALIMGCKKCRYSKIME